MLIDFSKEALTVPNNYLGADKKRTIIYKGEKYLLKFSTYNEFQQTVLQHHIQTTCFLNTLEVSFSRSAE